MEDEDTEYLLNLCNKGQYKLVKEAIEERDLDPNCQDRFGRSPLLMAASKGDLKLIQYLLSKGGDLFHLDNLGNNPLQMAIMFGKSELVEFILDEMKKRNQLGVLNEDQFGKNPLYFTIQRISRLRNRLNLSSGNQFIDSDRVSSFHKECIEIVELLLNHLVAVGMPVEESKSILSSIQMKLQNINEEKDLDDLEDLIKSLVI
eukprot:TRINITY_DN2226_c0_g2_i2.p1 TRINITY_DN2226_c0_g2~~TRINITY_DN2226_c0_g2_i2.p1  ORF type:complete len:203 (-),score=74.80 TRINITY_DN2226_c0_g2_i2:943-1551(-)